MKKVLLVVGILAFIGLGVYQYVQYKLFIVEKTTETYLKSEKNLTEDNYKVDGFIANLSGNKNWMASVQIKGEDFTSFYFLNDDGELELESTSDQTSFSNPE